MSWASWTCGVVAFFVVLVLSHPVLKLLRQRQILDQPNHRSSHLEVTPRGGGIAVVAGLVGAMAFSRGPGLLRWGMILATFAVALVGLAEDLWGVPVTARFSLQLFAGALAAPLLIHDAHVARWVAGVAAIGGVLWLVAFVNAFNFMDGINGMSAFEAIVAGAAYAWMGRDHHPLLVSGGLAAAGASLAFLPFNFPRARMFLGDVGSYGLGAWLATLAILAIRYRLGVVAAIAPLAIYGADTGVTLAGRILRRDPWREPHREHTYQRLVHGGCTHAQVSTLVAGFVAACCVVGIAAPSRPIGDQAVLVVLIAAIVGGYLAIPTLRNFRWGRARL